MTAKKKATTGTRRTKSGARTRKWSPKVKTVSTFPPEGLFKKDAETVARTMASKRVSPKGIGSGIRMIQFFINRAGKTLSVAQRKQLERAKHILQERNNKERAERREKKGVGKPSCN